MGEIFTALYMVSLLVRSNVNWCSWRNLQKLLHPTAYGIFQKDSHIFSGVEEDVLQSRFSLLHHQRDRA